MTELMVETPREERASVEAVGESGDEDKLTLELLGKAVVRLMKQDISERYAKTRKITDEDREFCEKIDWHPVDEMPMKEEAIRELREAEKGPHSKPMTPDELEKWFDML